MILTDTFIVENVQLITERRNGVTVTKLRGTFGRCDEKNNNGRIYSKSLLEREVKKIAEAMTERRLLGELDHPSHDSVKLSNVSHLITDLNFQGNELMGECELLNTPSGKVAQALVEGGVKVGISSRGMGTLSEQADGTKTVNEDYKLVTFDLVADPSTRGAYPGLSESSQATLVEEIVTDTLNKAAKEKVFTTMLKDKIREKTAWGNQGGKPTEVKKNKGKPTAKEPFRNWEDFYSYNTSKPVVVKTRGYQDSETVTEPDEVTENRYGLLRKLLFETGKPEGGPDVPPKERHTKNPLTRKGLKRIATHMRHHFGRYGSATVPASEHPSSTQLQTPSGKFHRFMQKLAHKLSPKTFKPVDPSPAVKDAARLKGFGTPSYYVHQPPERTGPGPHAAAATAAKKKADK